MSSTRTGSCWVPPESLEGRGRLREARRDDFLEGLGVVNFPAGCLKRFFFGPSLTTSSGKEILSSTGGSASRSNSSESHPRNQTQERVWQNPKQGQLLFLIPSQFLQVFQAQTRALAVFPPLF